jgi:hypothetical protein
MEKRLHAKPSASALRQAVPEAKQSPPKGEHSKLEYRLFARISLR